ncbi:MAG: M28 family peptidase [Bdellovibrionota bacterium]
MMKLIFASVLLSTSAFAARYQVINQHPHDLAQMKKHVTTVSKFGRLWIVEGTNVPEKVLKNLKLITGRERHYSYAPIINPIASNVVRNQITKMSETLIRDYVVKLAGYKTRLAGTTENERAVEEIEKNLAELGYVTSQICYSGKKCSIIAEKKGTVSEDKVILVEAHMDSVGRDFAGADDNASGTAVLMEMARVLSSHTNKKTIRFFVTNGEEGGLLGAEHYVKTLKASGEIKKLVLGINMDMVGWNSNGIVELETNAEYDNLAKWFAGLAATYTTLKTKITLGAWGSDHVPFLKAGVPTLLTIEDWSTKTPCYHAACDKPEGLNYAYATEIGKLNVAAVMTKDAE